MWFQWVMGGKERAVGQRGTATDKYLTGERQGRQKLAFLSIISGGNVEFGKVEDCLSRYSVTGNLRL